MFKFFSRMSKVISITLASVIISFGLTACQEKEITFGLLCGKGLDDGTNTFMTLLSQGAKRTNSVQGIHTEVVYFENEMLMEKHKEVVGDYDYIISVMSNLDNTENYPEQKYVLVESDLEAPNVLSLMVDNWQAGYSAGVLAAGISETNTIGIVLGKQVATQEDFLNGYLSGAKSVRSDINVIHNYTNSWTDVEIGKNIALSQYSQGADILFSVAAGVVNAAAEVNKLVIGIDVNQNGIAPNCVVASIVKHSDVMLESAIQDVKKNGFKPQVSYYGFENGTIEVDFDGSAVPVSDSVKASLEDAINKLKSGEVSKSKN